MQIEDRSKPAADGEVFIKPFRSDRVPIANPFSCFHDPQMAEEAARGISAECPNGYIPLGSNLIVDNFRTVAANLLGGKDFPTNKWVVSYFSIGTFDTAPAFTDQTLSPQPNPGLGLAGGENEIQFSSGVYKKMLTSVDWPEPNIVRFELTIEPGEANGYLIREAGLWTAGAGTTPWSGGVLVARKAIPAITKTSDYGYSLLWRIRL